MRQVLRPESFEVVIVITTSVRDKHLCSIFILCKQSNTTLFTFTLLFHIIPIVVNITTYCITKFRCAYTDKMIKQIQLLLLWTFIALQKLNISLTATFHHIGNITPQIYILRHSFAFLLFIFLNIVSFFNKRSLKLTSWQYCCELSRGSKWFELCHHVAALRLFPIPELLTLLIHVLKAAFHIQITTYRP